MAVPNSKQWSSAYPGYIIFLVDQSGSMNEPYSDGRTKAEFTALIINDIIKDLIFSNMNGNDVKDRVFISVIGYGGSGTLAVDDIRSEYLSHFANHPLRTDRVKKKVSDGAGGLVEVDVTMPVFIDPVANGLTPMSDAFSFAKELINGWMNKMPENPAPIIINISDGLPYAGNRGFSEKQATIDVCKEIMNIQTSDGSPIIFNSHIGDGEEMYQFIEKEHEIVDDEQALFLFSVSSNVPESYLQASRKWGFDKVTKESKGFISNSSAEVFVRFINFGSSGGLQ